MNHYTLELQSINCQAQFQLASSVPGKWRLVLTKPQLNSIQPQLVLRLLAQWLALQSRPVVRDGFLLAYTMWC